MKKFINILSTVILIFMIGLVVFLFAVRLSGNTPSLFGYHVFRVSSGSMEPTLMQNDVILVKKTPASDIHKDDIVTYVSKEGQMSGEFITHRVVVEPEMIDGVYHYQTQGDLDGAALDPIITYDQIKGKFICKVPFIDKIYGFFFTPYGLITFIFVIIALFGYELISLIISYKSLDNKDDDITSDTVKKE